MSLFRLPLCQDARSFGYGGASFLPVSDEEEIPLPFRFLTMKVHLCLKRRSVDASHPRVLC